MTRLRQITVVSLTIAFCSESAKDGRPHSVHFSCRVFCLSMRWIQGPFWNLKGSNHTVLYCTFSSRLAAKTCKIPREDNNRCRLLDSSKAPLKLSHKLSSISTTHMARGHSISKTRIDDVSLSVTRGKAQTRHSIIRAQGRARY